MTTENAPYAGPTLPLNKFSTLLKQFLLSSFRVLVTSNTSLNLFSLFRAQVSTKAPLECMCRPCTGVEESAIVPQEIAGYADEGPLSHHFRTSRWNKTNKLCQTGLIHFYDQLRAMLSVRLHENTSSSTQFQFSFQNLNWPHSMWNKRVWSISHIIVSSETRRPHNLWRQGGDKFQVLNAAVIKEMYTYIFAYLQHF